MSLPEGITALLVDGERVLVQGREQVLVESKSQPGTHHTVEYDEDRILWVCTCISFQARQRCRHARAIDRWAGGKADVRFLKEDA